MISIVVQIKVEDIERTTMEIDEARSGYVPVAERGSILFFCLSDMANVDPMYQYSLEWFAKLFVRSMAETEHNGKLSCCFITVLIIILARDHPLLGIALLHFSAILLSFTSLKFQFFFKLSVKGKKWTLSMV